jgi:hypothetical protein
MKVKLKNNINNYVSLEIAPYMNQTFYPNVEYEVEEKIYNRFKEHYLIKIPELGEELIVDRDMISWDEPEILIDIAENITVEIIEEKSNKKRRKGK